jgi:hypothetical protein
LGANPETFTVGFEDIQEIETVHRQHYSHKNNCLDVAKIKREIWMPNQSASM